MNAIMHRDYRTHQAIQIIRYANRIEIRNPGYSLIAEEHLGEPGSKSRNLKLSEVLHDTNFSEKKGTGIGLMRQQMKNAGLSPPLFESDRNRGLFIATFLFHHFLSDEDISWLANFKKYQLSDEQTKALIFIREVGAINNAAYRNLNQVDTLAASSALRQLRSSGLFDAKNQGVTTYYVPSMHLIDSINKNINRPDDTHQLESKTHQLEGKTHQLEGKTHQLEGKTHQPEIIEIDIQALPDALQGLLQNLNKKSSVHKVRLVILALCSFQEMTAIEIAAYLRRQDKKHLVRKFLTPMIKENLLVYKYPQMPEHPQQKYRRKMK